MVETMQGINKSDVKNSDKLYSYNINLKIRGNVFLEDQINQNFQRILEKYFLAPDEKMSYEITDINIYNGKE